VVRARRPLAASRTSVLLIRDAASGGLFDIQRTLRGGLGEAARPCPKMPEDARAGRRRRRTHGRFDGPHWRHGVVLYGPGRFRELPKTS